MIEPAIRNMVDRVADIYQIAVDQKAAPKEQRTSFFWPTHI